MCGRMGLASWWRRRPLLRQRVAWVFRIGVNIFAALGLSLIGYEIAASLSGERWAFMDVHAPSIGAFLTLVGALFTIVSVYFYTPRTTPPEWLSVWITAPILGAACIVTLAKLIAHGSISANVVNGFAILAISGALFRIQPHPLHADFLFADDHAAAVTSSAGAPSTGDARAAPPTPPDDGRPQ